VKWLAKRIRLLSRSAEGGREWLAARIRLSWSAEGDRELGAALVLFGLAGAVYACGSTPPPKPPMQADSPLPSEVEDSPDASAAAWAHDDGDGGLGEGGGLLTNSGGSLASGSEDGAKTLLTQFVAPNADTLALTRSLRPTSADYKALFDSESAPKIETAQAKDWDSGKAEIKPGGGQTEIKIESASGADLVTGKGAAKDFPKDYKKFAKHIVPTATLFRFKFVKPGEDAGTAYDGLAFVNGHWCIVLKPYLALGAAATSDDSKTAAKKKPGKKKKK
jgi:hypothetical protein